ncbi:MAG: glutamate-1-semialdehyde 2,1-aminomutase [Chloroflexi bacterium]|nr:glutamate-1-semialdehyde 2,1-aminomutase [Chloroflexota bacterium]
MATDPIKRRTYERSQQLFHEAQGYLPGGVDSPVRAFKAVGGTPRFMVRGQGSKIYDADGNDYIDYVNSWGPLILGHANPQVVAGLKKAVGRGTSFGAPSELEITLAKLICAAMPSIEMLRFVNSGTEATMTALRLARAFTGRDRIVKFAGGYHGHADGLLTKSGSGLATLGIPDSPGVPLSYAQNTLVVPYNNIEAVEQLFRRYRKEIAAIIVEPVAANMGVVLPQSGFLAGLRRLTTQFGAVLIFDEVITGFRVAYGGAQALYGITPDLTCLGKIIGGGLPVGAYGGRRDIMQLIAPSGPVYQAGTLSGNPLVMTAGIETLRVLSQPGTYEQLEAGSSLLEKGIAKAASNTGISLYLARVASLLTAFFTTNPVIDYETAKQCDTSLFARFFQHLLAEGVYWPPSQFEAAFISLAHSEKDIQTTVNVIGKAFSRLREQF